MNTQLLFYISDMNDVRNYSTTLSVIHLNASRSCAWITKWFWLWLCCYGYGVLVPHCSSAQRWWMPHQPQFVCLHWGRPGNDPWSAEVVAWLSVETRANRGHLSIESTTEKCVKTRRHLNNSNIHPFLYNEFWATSFLPSRFLKLLLRKNEGLGQLGDVIPVVFPKPTFASPSRQSCFEQLLR